MLKREIGFKTAVIYGLGIIIGAGIYSLIGVGAAIAGNMLYLSFILCAFITICTGLSYAELSSLFPKESAEYHYSLEAFRNRELSFLVGFLIALAATFGSATVALGFSGYFVSVVSSPPVIVAVIVLALMGAINFLGIKSAAWINDTLTILSIIGLLIIIGIGLTTDSAPTFDAFKMPEGGLGSVFSAISVIFFACIGFESIARISEEVKNPKRNVPMAIIFSILISSLLYALVAFTALKAIGPEALANSTAPLSLVVSKVFSDSYLFSILVMFAIPNTILIFILSAAHLLWGMSKEGALPKIFSHMNKKSVPIYCISLVSIFAMLAAYFADIRLIAELSDLSIFLCYLIVNLSLIKINIENKQQMQKSHIKSPRVFGQPVLAYLGVFGVVFMLFHFRSISWLLEGTLVIIGMGLYFLSKKPHREQHKSHQKG